MLGSSVAQNHFPNANAVQVCSKALKLKESIDSNIKEKTYKETHLKTEYIPGADNSFTLYKDSIGKVRKYVVGGGTDDSALTVSYYYNNSLKLILVKVEYGSVRGETINQIAVLDNKLNIVQVLYMRDFQNKDLNFNEHEEKSFKELQTPYWDKINFITDPIVDFTSRTKKKNQ